MKKESDDEKPMNPKDLYEKTIRDLNEQLYQAYKRISQLNQKLQNKREKNGKD
jgi:prefoldin subunit 5